MLLPTLTRASPTLPAELIAKIQELHTAANERDREVMQGNDHNENKETRPRNAKRISKWEKETWGRARAGNEGHRKRIWRNVAGQFDASALVAMGRAYSCILETSHLD